MNAMTPPDENSAAGIEGASKTSDDDASVWSDSWADFRRSIPAGIGDSLTPVVRGVPNSWSADGGEDGEDDAVARGRRASARSEVASSARSDRSLGVSFPALTPGEWRDLRGWNRRLARETVFSRYYFPEPWEMRELETLQGFLKLEHPDAQSLVSWGLESHCGALPAHLPPDCCNIDPQNALGQEAAKKTIDSIFFPGDHDPKSVLLKRGPVLIDGVEERELMLFTRGFLLSRVGFDAIVNLLFTVNAENPNYLSSKSLRERFDSVDSDNNNHIDRCELKETFAGMGVPVGELTLTDIMERFDTDHTGLIEYSEFQTVMQSHINPKKEERWTWGSLGEKWMSMMPTGHDAKDKLDCAYQLSEIEHIESINVCCSEPTKMFAQSSLREVIFAIFLEDRESPLLVVCSKPEHKLAWVDAFRICYVKWAKLRADGGCSAAKANQSCVGWQHRVVRASLFSFVVCNDVTGLKEQVSNPSPDIHIDDQDEYYGYTALHYAVILGREDCAILLMQCGANVSLLDYNHHTPLDHAVLSENKCTRSNTIQELERYGAKQQSPGVLFKSAIEEQRQMQSGQRSSTTGGKLRAKAKKASGVISDAMSALRMRGERLEGLDSKAAQLHSGAANYAEMAKQIKEKNKQKAKFVGV